MPFKAGNQHGKANAGRKKESPKTIWLLQSMAANGVDLQDLMAKSLIKAAKGDRQALDLSHLLAKFLPYVSNAPKNDMQVNQIETLVINRIEQSRPVSVDTMAVIETDGPTLSAADGLPPSSMDA